MVKLLIDIKIKSKDNIKNSKILFDTNPNYLKTIRFADNSLKSFLIESAEYVNSVQKTNIYEEAKKLLKSGNKEDIIKAKKLFLSLSDYENAEIYASRCDERISELESYEEAKIKNKKVLKIAAIISPFVIIGIILYAVFIPPLLEYNEAVDNYNSGYYQAAYYYFSDSTYKDSAEMALKCQYAYVKDNYDNNNETTYDYLKELKAQNYKDSSELYKELYAWNVELDCCNTNPGDYEKTLSSIPKETKYLHMQFTLTGGEPGKSITIYHTVQWPNKNKSTSDWYWEDKSDGSGLGFEYSEGVSSASGTCTIEFYNAEDDSFIDRVSIPVGN